MVTFLQPYSSRGGPSCPSCCVALTWHRFGAGALVPGNWGRRMPNGGKREDELLENMALIKPDLALGRVGEMLQISPASQEAFSHTVRTVCWMISRV